MIIESRLSRLDYIRINLRMSLRKQSVYLALIAGLVLTGVAMLTGLYILLFVWLWLAYVVAIPLYRVLRAAYSSKNANFFLPTRRTFSEKGVQTESPKSSGMVYWNTFVKWQRTPNYYLLYISPRSFVGIPRSRVPDVEAFEKLLRTKIRPAGR